MRVHRLLQRLMVLVLAASMSACTNPLSSLFGGNSSTSSTGTSTTDTFNGALAPSGSLVFGFTVTTAGSVAVTLTSVSPATTSPIELGIGPSSNGSCSITNSTSGATASANAQLSVTEAAGTYCVKISDSTGTLPTTSNVIVTVTHS